MIETIKARGKREKMLCNGGQEVNMVDVIKASIEESYTRKTKSKVINYGDQMFLIGQLYGEGKISFDESEELLEYNKSLLLKELRIG